VRISESSLLFQFRLRNDLYCVEWGVKLYSLTIVSVFWHEATFGITKKQLTSIVLGGRVGCWLQRSTLTEWLTPQSDSLAFTLFSILHRAIWCLQKQIVSNRLGPVLLWLRPRHRFTLLTHALWQSRMSICPDFALQSSGWQTSECEPVYERCWMSLSLSVVSLCGTDNRASLLRLVCLITRQ